MGVAMTLDLLEELARLRGENAQLKKALGSAWWVTNLAELAIKLGEAHRLIHRLVDENQGMRTALRVSNEAIGQCFSDVLWHCERPLLRTAPIPLFLLSDLVRRTGYKAVVTGEGADEVFGGYNIFREAKIRRHWSRAPESQRRANLIGQLYPYIFNGTMFNCFSIFPVEDARCVFKIAPFKQIPNEEGKAQFGFSAEDQVKT